jgi:hypothetical protein
MQSPNDFYTSGTLFTLLGSSSATWLITSVLSDIFGYKIKKYKKLIALIISIGLTLLGASLSTDRSFSAWIIAIINGFLVYATSVGVNTVASKSTKRIPVQPTGGSDNSFLESWW